jgi:hypothetical protein
MVVTSAPPPVVALYTTPAGWLIDPTLHSHLLALSRYLTDQLPVLPDQLPVLPGQLPTLSVSTKDLPVLSDQLYSLSRQASCARFSVYIYIYIYIYICIYIYSLYIGSLIVRVD